jgi:cytoskeleton protein RodZ
MKEIGKQLKEARESIGISIEEASEDLKIRPSQIENIEAGNSSAFDDVFYLKYFIRDYAKYLGLDKEEMVDEFNEFLFDYTSKLSLDDIKDAKNIKRNKKQTKTIHSPYTVEKKSNTSFIPFLVYGLIAILVMLIIYFVITLNSNDDEFEEGTVIQERK